MFKTLIVGVLLGIVAAGAILRFVPVVDQGRERSIISVQPNGGNRESFHVNLPADRVFAGRPGDLGPIPEAAQWPSFMRDRDVQAELFKLRNEEQNVVGVASRFRLQDGSSAVEWAVHMPARGTLYTVLDAQPNAAGLRTGALRGGTREFSGLQGSVIERYQADDEASAGGRLELTATFVGSQELLPAEPEPLP